jgi:UPF0176 protein
MKQYQVVSFYKFSTIEDESLNSLKTTLKQYCIEEGILGTVLLATEGINGTIAGNPAGIQKIIEFLQSESGLFDLDCKYSISDFIPFQKIKILLKKEIVTIGIPTVDPTKMCGIKVAPEAWNQLMSDPEILLLDTRNIYEIEKFGTFKGALNPKTEHFRDFPGFVDKHLDPKKHKKIAMFCTGGIRCEKASSYMLSKGFETVYQLEGGILKYLEKIPTNEQSWEGKCFVFDDRIVLEKEHIGQLG